MIREIIMLFNINSIISVVSFISMLKIMLFFLFGGLKVGLVVVISYFLVKCVYKVIL